MPAFLVIFILIASGAAHAESMGWDQLRDLTERSSYTLRAKRASIKAQQSARKTVYAELLPTLDLVASDARRETEPKDPTEPNKSIEFGLESSLTLANGLSSLTRLEQESARVQLKSSEFKKVSQSLRLNLRKAFFETLIAQRRLQLAKKIAQRRKRNEKVITLKYRSGAEAKWSLEQAKFQTEDAELFVFDQLSRLEEISKDLQAITSDPTLKASSISGAIEQILDRVPKGFELESHPDFQLAKDQLRISELQIRLVRSEFFPSVSAAFNLTNQKYDQNEATDVTEYGVSFTLPLFAGFSRINKLRAAKNSETEALKELEQAKLDLKSKVENAESRLQIARKRVPIAKNLLSSAEQRVETVTVQYRNGLRRYLDWEQAQTQLVERENSYIDALSRALLALAEYEAALGWDLNR